jgi:nucleotide-binding universal stress UspA family protein
MFKHFLIPIVPEPCSENAARMGLEFAKAMKARVTFAYVMSKMDTTTYGHGVLKTWSNHALEYGVLSDEMLIGGMDGHIGDVIVKETLQKDYDLIVMGTHARSGLNRLLMGSVTERVVRTTKIPVLVSRAENTIGKFQRILVPIDTEPNSQLALLEAKKLALELQAKLHIVHVIPAVPVPLGDPVGAFTAFDYAGLAKSFEEAGQKAVNDAMEASKELQPTRTLLFANTERIENLLVQSAKDAHADLIVMSTHARSGFDRLLLGSVAEGVVHRSSVPVLLLRAIPKDNMRALIVVLVLAR